MKLQLLFAPALLLAVVFDLAARPRVPVLTLVLGGFLLTTLPFTLRAIKKDPMVGLLSPVLLAARACAQVLGVAGGVIYARRKPIEQSASSKPTPDCGT
jgi:hypothetical protein